MLQDIETHSLIAYTLTYSNTMLRAGRALLRMERAVDSKT